jgi:hypothetical protein
MAQGKAILLYERESNSRGAKKYRATKKGRFIAGQMLKSQLEAVDVKPL